MKIKQMSKGFIDKMMKEELYYQEVEDKLLIGDRFHVYVLDKDNCLVDTSKCKNINLFTKFYNNPGDLIPLYESNEAVYDAKEIIDIYYADDEKEKHKVGINPKFLKYFEDYKLMASKEHDYKIVYVCKDDEIMGFVCSVRLKENE